MRIAPIYEVTVQNGQITQRVEFKIATIIMVIMVARLNLNSFWVPMRIIQYNQ